MWEKKIYESNCFIKSLKLYQKRVQNFDFLKLERFNLKIRQNKKVSRNPIQHVSKYLENIWADPGAFDMPILYNLFLRFSSTFLNV